MVNGKQPLNRCGRLIKVLLVGNAEQFAVLILTEQTGEFGVNLVVFAL